MCMLLAASTANPVYLLLIYKGVEGEIIDCEQCIPVQTYSLVLYMHNEGLGQADEQMVLTARLC